MRETPELAIEAACGLIEGGVLVSGIGTGPLADCIGGEHIARIYDLWRRTRVNASIHLSGL